MHNHLTYYTLTNGFLNLESGKITISPSKIGNTEK